MFDVGWSMFDVQGVSSASGGFTVSARQNPRMDKIMLHETRKILTILLKVRHQFGG